MEIENLNIQLQEMFLVKTTKNLLSEIWNKKNNKSGVKFGDEFRYLFGLRLFEYAQGKRYDYTTKILPEDKELRTKIIKSYRKTRVSSSLAKQSQRLTLGYNSLTLHLSPKICNLSSEAANKNFKDTTSDHIIGVTLCAQYIINIFQEGKESKFIDWQDENWLDNRIDYMCNIWLKDNLWLWTQCRITKDEHNPKNGLLRNMVKETIFEEIIYRADLRHYKKAKIVVALDYKNITP
jgi:hypothetical protein